MSEMNKEESRQKRDIRMRSINDSLYADHFNSFS